MVDAYKYMIKYQSDDTFDNMYIDSNLTSHEGEQLVPIRRWEFAENYQVTSRFKLSKKYKAIFDTVEPFGLCLGQAFFVEVLLSLKIHQRALSKVKKPSK